MSCRVLQVTNAADRGCSVCKTSCIFHYLQILYRRNYDVCSVMTSKAKVLLPTLLGSVIEYYDFGIYAVFAPIIGVLFFPKASEFIRTLLTFGVFAFGFLMRPLGGILFGFIGDRFGRRKALNLSIVGMAFSTISLCALPGYSMIGIYAPIFLTLIRLVQGLCIGGEGVGAAVFILEHFTKKNLSVIIGSLVMGANIFGTLFANLVGLGIDKLVGLDTFTWRAGFVVGGVLGIIGVYVRTKNVEETPIFDQLKRQNKILKMPFVTLMREKWKIVFLAVGVACVATSTAYMVRGYLNTFFIQVMGYDVERAFEFTSFSLLAMIFFLPIFGVIAGFVGQSRFLNFTAMVIILAVFPIFYMISNAGKDVYQVYLGLLLLSIVGAAISAPAYPYIINAFPPEFRYSGVAMGWNIGNALFGGTTPMISAILVEKLGVIAPAYYLICTAIIFLIISRVMYRYSYENLRKMVMSKRLLEARFHEGG